MLRLDTEVRYLKGIGEAKAKAFARLGVRNIRDLLSFSRGHMRTGAQYCRFQNL